MSSEAITRNDLKAVLDEVLPAEPSEYRKLLWTNPSPTSSFVAQTITVPDISEYDDLEMVTRGGSATTGNTFKYPVAQLLEGNVHWLTFIGQGATGLPSVNGRPFNVVSSTQIHFELGGWWNTAGNNSGLATSGVPLKIYGIKYERVAPPQVEYPNYSTEEQQVGTWIDGKPIYRKVINVPSLTAGLNTITAPSNIDTFVTLRGMEKESGGAQAPIPKAHYSAFAYQIGMYYSGGNIYIEVGSNFTYITSACVICEYTKTTD